jgi:hypothetical protein
MLSVNSDTKWEGMYCMQDPAAPRPRPPSPGERASGHGLEGVVATVLACQPLAEDDVWRVTLAGEPFGRLVSPAPDGSWHLLQLEELTDAQLDVLEAATATPTPC